MQLTLCDMCRKELKPLDKPVHLALVNLDIQKTYMPDMWDLCSECLNKAFKFLRPEF